MTDRQTVCQAVSCFFQSEKAAVLDLFRATRSPWDLKSAILPRHAFVTASLLPAFPLRLLFLAVSSRCLQLQWPNFQAQIMKISSHHTGTAKQMDRLLPRGTGFCTALVLFLLRISFSFWSVWHLNHAGHLLSFSSLLLVYPYVALAYFCGFFYPGINIRVAPIDSITVQSQTAN